MSETDRWLFPFYYAWVLRTQGDQSGCAFCHWPETTWKDLCRVCELRVGGNKAREHAARSRLHARLSGGPEQAAHERAATILQDQANGLKEKARDLADLRIGLMKKGV